MLDSTSVRVGVFLLVFCLMAAWENAAPARKLLHKRSLRWSSNMGIVALNSALVRILFPLTAFQFAEFCTAKTWGLFNNLSLAYLAKFLVSLVVLDLAIYFQHVMFHAVPLFWRLHRMHHTDTDYDVTTGNRFHTIEILLSMLIKFAVIALMGPPALAVLLFEILLNGVAMFNHGNVKIPAHLDKLLRYFIVTPNMHRIHHSVEGDETNSNFGFNLPWWDRIFGTYRARARKSTQDMTIGIASFREGKYQALPWMIAIPFLPNKDSEASNRHKPKTNKSA